MNLKVIQSDAEKPPWYGGGLRFTCTQCGNCCTGPEGVVWISDEEIGRLAKHLKMSRARVLEQYCRKVGSKYSLREVRNAQGEYDCIFLKEIKTPSTGKKDKVVQTRRGCSIYPVRPLQCRTWPFWDGNLSSPQSWSRASLRCHGMNNGGRVFTHKQIEALRNATDWPQNPPTSK